MIESRRNRWTRLALLCLLLAIHSLSFAHEMGHFAAGEGSPCAVCSVADGLDSPVDVSSQPAPEAPETLVVRRSTQSLHHQLCDSGHAARAPPANP